MAGYGDDADFTAKLAEWGLTLPAAAPSLAVLRQIGSDYVDAAYEPRLQCSRRAEGFDQDRAWPRSGHSQGGKAVPEGLIPQAWVTASYRAAYREAAEAGWATSGRDPSRLTKREKVEGIEREFFGVGEGGARGNVAPGFNMDARIDGMLTPWLCDASGAPGWAWA